MPHPNDVLILKGRAATKNGGQDRRVTRAEWEAEHGEWSDTLWHIERVEPWVPKWRSAGALAAVAYASLLLSLATLIVAAITLIVV